MRSRSGRNPRAPRRRHDPEELTIADDRVQRRAQLMAHVGQELALGPVRCLGGFFRRLERFQSLALGNIASVQDHAFDMWIVQPIIADDLQDTPVAVVALEADLDRSADPAL